VNPIYWPIDDESFVRTYTPDDAEAAFALVDANRDRLDRWMPWVRMTRSPEDTRAFIQRAIASEHDLEGNGIWVGRDLAGAIGLRVDPLSHKGEIGYWIGEAFEGRGLVTRACRLFIDHGFRELGLHRVELHAGVENVRSRAVAERLGFLHEGTLREADRVQGDRYIDMAVYGLLDREWPPP
jgi:ribosomal-protein-serine acetyltransferase